MAKTISSMTFESKITSGGFYYVNTFEFDDINQSLEITLGLAPEENSEAKRFLWFSDIENVTFQCESDALQESSDGVIDSIIGLEEVEASNDIKYEIVLEDRIIHFTTKRKVDISSIGLEKQFN